MACRRSRWWAAGPPWLPSSLRAADRAQTVSEAVLDGRLSAVSGLLVGPRAVEPARPLEPAIAADLPAHPPCLVLARLGDGGERLIAHRLLGPRAVELG